MKKKKKTMELKEPAMEKLEEKEYEMGYVKGQRLKACLFLLGGTVFLLVSVWLYSRTLGTNLLFTDAFLGKISRYYWIVLIPAAIALVIGALMMRKRKIPKAEEPAATEGAGSKEAVKAQPESRPQPEPQFEPQPNPQSTGEPKSREAAAEKVVAAEGAGSEEPAAGDPVQRTEGVEVWQTSPEVAEEKTLVAAEEPKAELLVAESSANTCPNCGKERHPGNAFCVYCGYKF